MVSMSLELKKKEDQKAKKMALKSTGLKNPQMEKNSKTLKRNKVKNLNKKKIRKKKKLKRKKKTQGKKMNHPTL